MNLNIGLITLIVCYGGLFSLMFGMFLKNKNEKGLNKKTRAKITEAHHYNVEKWDSEDRRTYTVTYYSIDYEFTVNDMYYVGHGLSKYKKKAGQRIKIYYNKEEPQKNGTAEERNFFLRWLIFIIVMMILVFGSLIFIDSQ